MVVTLCADEVLYLPVTTEITSLPQLTPEGLPLALARRAAEQARMARAATALEERCEAVASRALAQAAHISREHGVYAGSRQRETGARAFGPMLSVLQYSSHSTSHNRPAVENNACTELPERAPESVGQEASPSASDSEPLIPTLPAVCPAASHRLLWRWLAGAWHCPLCKTSSQPTPNALLQPSEQRHL